jgi:hypothetical protein
MARIYLEQALGIAAALWAFYRWTGMPEGSGGEVALSALALLASVGLLVFCAWRGYRQLRSQPPGGPAWPIHLLLFPLSLGFAYWIAWWVPQLEGYGAQLASMLVRFALGYVVAVAGWVGLLRAVAGARSRPSTVAAGGGGGE